MSASFGREVDDGVGFGIPWILAFAASADKRRTGTRRVEAAPARGV
jgi:hypothetical protein